MKTEPTDKLILIIEEMDRIHNSIMEKGLECTCYSDPDGSCPRCNKSIKLSYLATKAVDQYDARMATLEDLLRRWLERDLNMGSDPLPEWTRKALEE